MFVIQFGAPTRAITFMRMSEYSPAMSADRPSGQTLAIFNDIHPVPVSQPCGYTVATVKLPNDWIAVSGVQFDAADLPIRIQTLGKDVPEQGVWLTGGKPDQSIMKTIRRLYEYAAAAAIQYYRPMFRQAAGRFGGK